jgi:hypothetical protein
MKINNKKEFLEVEFFLLCPKEGVHRAVRGNFFFVKKERIK